MQGVQLFADTKFLPVLFRRTTYVSANFCTPLKFLFSIYIFPDKNIGTKSSKPPSNPLKPGISLRVSTQPPHGLDISA